MVSVRTRLVIDLGALHIVLTVMTGWLDRQEREAVAYLYSGRWLEIRSHYLNGPAVMTNATGFDVRGLLDAVDASFMRSDKSRP